MNTPPTITPEFANLFVEEPINPFRACIQGLANEPVTVLALLRRAEAFLRREPDFGGLGDYSQQIIVERLAGGRPVEAAQAARIINKEKAALLEFRIFWKLIFYLFLLFVLYN